MRPNARNRARRPSPLPSPQRGEGVKAQLPRGLSPRRGEGARRADEGRRRGTGIRLMPTQSVASQAARRPSPLPSPQRGEGEKPQQPRGGARRNT
jgi:hypothetical protein